MFVRDERGGGVLPDSVRVTLHQTAANSNAVPTNFLRIAGFHTWDVNVEAVARRFVPDCIRDGLIAHGIVAISSNNGFVNRICVHGQQGVAMQNHNFYELGVTVSMPDPDTMLTIPSGGMTSNPGLPEALRENILDPRMVNHIDEIMADMLTKQPGVLPSYIDAAKPISTLAATSLAGSTMFSATRTNRSASKTARRSLTLSSYPNAISMLDQAHSWPMWCWDQPHWVTARSRSTTRT
jgi:hypothetical protein